MLLDCRLKPSAQVECAFAVCFGQTENELVASVASHEVTAACGRAKDVGDLPQHLIAREMTESVVVLLELIDVCYHDRDRPSIAMSEL